MEKKHLLWLMEEESGYITTKEATNQGIHRQYLTELVREGKLERISSGLYQSPRKWEDFLYAFQHKKSQAIYSHETALFLHGLSDRDPIQHAVTLPSGYHSESMKGHNLRVFFVKPPLFRLGVTTMKTPFGNLISVYNMERTICDLIRSRNRMDYSLVAEGIRRYSRRADKDINRLLEYAKSFRVEKIIKQYLGLLL